MAVHLLQELPLHRSGGEGDALALAAVGVGAHVHHVGVHAAGVGGALQEDHRRGLAPHVAEGRTKDISLSQGIDITTRHCTAQHDGESIKK